MENREKIQEETKVSLNIEQVNFPYLTDILTENDSGKIQKAFEAKENLRYVTSEYSSFDD